MKSRQPDSEPTSMSPVGDGEDDGPAPTKTADSVDSVAEHVIPPGVLRSPFAAADAAGATDLFADAILDDRGEVLGDGDDDRDDGADSLLADISPEALAADLVIRSGAPEPDAEPESDTARQALSPARLRSVLESLLFVADKPLTVQRLQELLEEQAGEPSARGGPPLYQPIAIHEALQSLAHGYIQEGRGIELHQIAGGWQLRTASSNAAWVQRQLQQKPQRLSRAQLETLAIVAYRQPITRPEIDDVRGVDSGGALKTLLERRLVRILGKKEEPGRPLLYGTTKEFLEFFNLRDLKDLPTLREYYELSDEHKATVRAAHPGAPLEGLVLGPEVTGSTDGAVAPRQMEIPTAPTVATDAVVVSQAPPAAGENAAAAPAGDGSGAGAEAAKEAAAASTASRIGVLDQQLADDEEALRKIDEMIAAVNVETPPLDVLLGMADAAASAGDPTHEGAALEPDAALGTRAASPPADDDDADDENDNNDVTAQDGDDATSATASDAADTEEEEDSE